MMPRCRVKVCHGRSWIHRWTHPSVILVATDLERYGTADAFCAPAGTRVQGAHYSACMFSAAGAAVAVDAVGNAVLRSGRRDRFCRPRRCSPGAMSRAGRNVACDGIVREGNAAQQMLAVARQFNADRLTSRDPEPEQGEQAASWLRGRTSAALGQSPGHYRGTRGSSPGERRRTAERVVLHATTLRETSRPSAALACQIASDLKAKLVLLHVLAACRRDAARTFAYGIRFDGDAGVAHSCGRNRRH